MPGISYTRRGPRTPRAGFVSDVESNLSGYTALEFTRPFGNRHEKFFSLIGPRPRHTADILALSPAAWWDASDSTAFTPAGAAQNQNAELDLLLDKSGNAFHMEGIAGAGPTITAPFIVVPRVGSRQGLKDSQAINDLPCLQTGSLSSSLRTQTPRPFAFEEMYCVVELGTSNFTASNRLINAYRNDEASFWFIGAALGQGLTTPHPVYVNGGTVDQSDDLFPALNSPCLLRMTSATGVLTTTDQLYIGAGPDIGATNNGWGGKIGEMIMFPTALSERDRMFVETYLAIKWGIGTINRAPKVQLLTISHLPEITGSTVVRPPAVPLTLGSPAVQVLTAVVAEVPTTPLTLTAIRPGEIDPEFANVSLLLPLTTADGFTDLSANGFTMSVFGSAAIVTSDSDFPEGALDLNGSSQYLRTPADAAFAFGTGPFTIEGFIKPDVVSGNDGLFTTGDDDSGAMVALFGGNILWSLTGSGGGTGGAISAGVRQHIALTRDSSSDVRLFLGGTQLDTTINSTVNLTDNQLSLGYYFTSSFLFDGRVNWFRVTKGVARYTSNFTPPSIPFPDS